MVMGSQRPQPIETQQKHVTTRQSCAAFVPNPTTISAWKSNRLFALSMRASDVHTVGASGLSPMHHHIHPAPHEGTGAAERGP